VVQVSLALALLICSGLMIRTFRALTNVNPGFAQPEQPQTFRIHIVSTEAIGKRIRLSCRGHEFTGVRKACKSFSSFLFAFHSNFARICRDLYYVFPAPRKAVSAPGSSQSRARI
jgi:hypothetical protein